MTKKMETEKIPEQVLTERKKPAETKEKTGTTSLLDKIPVAAEWQKKLAPYIEMVIPIYKKIGDILDIISPYIMILFEKLLIVWAFIQKYNIDKQMMAFYGLALVFFGGQYILLLAAVEAYRMMGWQKTYKNLKIIWEDYCRLREVNAKDNVEDLDDNGIPDVDEISKKDLFTRKFLLFLRSADPDRVTPALQGLYLGFMSVVATLRIQFAQTLTLGATIGDIFAQFAGSTLGPILKAVVPAEYQKWIPHGIKYGCKTLGVSIAWMIQRVISAFYSAIRGAQLFVSSVLNWMREQGYLKQWGLEDKITDSNVVFNGLVFGIASIGFLSQMYTGFSIPFPFSILMLPFTLAENFLWYFVAIDEHYVPPQA